LRPGRRRRAPGGPTSRPSAGYGVWRWFLLRISILRNADGTPYGGIGACSDITERRQAAEAQQTLLQRLRDSEQLFRDLADSVPQLVWIADHDGSASWYNRRWYSYTGMSAEESAGRGWMKAVHPDHVDRVVESLQQAGDTGEPLEVTFRMRSAEGHYRWFMARSLPSKDAEGRVTRMFGTSTDVTEQMEAQELLDTLLKEVSHRVKNSLALVSGLLMLQARSGDEVSRKALEDASLRVHAVARVHDLLWRHAGTREIDLEPFLDGLCEAVAAAAPRHHTTCSAAPARVSADLAVPIGVLVNELLTNAYKYAYPEGAEGEVRLSGTRAAEDRYRLEVADRGVGLPTGFDLARTGNSLGLRVITSLAAQLRGDLTVGSAEPGARFAIEFPIQQGT
jgi:PAS domain S-box-containing protein